MTAEALILTADRHADGLVVLIVDRDVHIRRQIAALHLRHEVRVHVESVLVDVQLVAESSKTSACKSSGHLFLERTFQWP